MTKDEYLNSVEQDLGRILADTKFNNNRNQLSAWKLSADFKRTYDEAYLWNRALFLSTNACQILLNRGNSRIVHNALKESALIYENLGAISESFDRPYCIVLSSFCYDLAGYQANAVCLLKNIGNYAFGNEESGIDLSADNYILSHLKLILFKNIPKGRSLIDHNLDNEPGIYLFNNAISAWYNHLLEDRKSDYSSLIKQVYSYYLQVRNVHVSQLLLMLNARMFVYNERSIAINLKDIGDISESEIWKKYFKLLANDVYDGVRVKDINKRLSKFEFWTSQLRAIEKGLLDKQESFVVQMPTSAGKTFVAELAILNALISQPGKKCLYISPFRALTNEKEIELSENLSKLGYSVSALSGSYEVDDFQDLVLSESDVLIATPEKMDLLLRQDPNFFNSVAIAVVDEGHILGDISPRSTLLEFFIIRLRMIIPELKFLFISAVMPPANADEYALWLSRNNGNVLRSLLHPDSSATEEWEPTRKLIGSFTWEGKNGMVSYLNIQTEDEVTKVITRSFIPSLIKKRQYASTFPDGANKAQTSAALGFRLAEDGNTLIYCAQVEDTKRVGNALVSLINAINEAQETVPAWANLNRDRESYFFARKWYKEDHYIPKCLERGIGVHFGDLPESVRRSVETDFARGNLKILIATNTVAQGLNFPIKNLVVHSTIMNGDPNNRAELEPRDFWNIVGRAGRAGMETEGQVIFNIKTPYDKLQFDFYTDRSKLNSANSLLLNVLQALVANRISVATFEENIKLLTEPYVLSILAEEVLENDDENLINVIFENSLFSVQIANAQLDPEPIRTSFKSIFFRIREDLKPEQIRAYGLTGLCVDSNSAIETFIEERLDEILLALQADNYQDFLSFIFDLMNTGQIDELKSQKMDKILRIGSISDFFEITLAWITGDDIDTLLLKWAELSDNPDVFNLLVSEGYYFRFPWIISSFIEILLFRLDLKRTDLPENINSVISFIKYGLDNPRACLLRSIGIKNREVAIQLDTYSGGLSGKDLIVFIANLTIQDIRGLDLTKFDEENIISVALKLTPQRFPLLPAKFSFWLKGVSYSEEQRNVSNTLKVDAELDLIRIFDNAFDPYAIEFQYEGKLVGYMPREYAKMISVEIDVNQTEYFTQVTEVVNYGNYQSIYVKIAKR